MDVVAKHIRSGLFWRGLKGGSAVIGIGLTFFLISPVPLFLPIVLMLFNWRKDTMPAELFGEREFTPLQIKAFRNALKRSNEGTRLNPKFVYSAFGITSNRGFLRTSSFISTSARYWFTRWTGVTSGFVAGIRIEHSWVDAEEPGASREKDIVDTTWKHKTKDGLRDYRFKDNYEIPIVRTHSVSLSFPTGEEEKLTFVRAEDAHNLDSLLREMFLPRRVADIVEDEPIIDYGIGIATRAANRQSKVPNPLRPPPQISFSVMPDLTNEDLAAFRKVMGRFDEITGSQFVRDLDGMPRNAVHALAETQVRLIIAEFDMPAGLPLADYMARMNDHLDNMAPEEIKSLASDDYGLSAAMSAPATPAKEDVTKILEELDEFVGADGAKATIRALIAMARVNKARADQRLPVVTQSYHLVFAGPPGTGKTALARLVARALHSLGFLSKGHLVEVDREGLVAGYLGQTATKTAKVIDSAIGGVLFIDEAYTLAADDDDFCKEAVATLLKRMEDQRHDLIVIAAGYPNEITNFLKSNPGLSSRFRNTVYFEDLEDDALVEIFERLCSKNGFTIEDGANGFVRQCLTNARMAAGEHFGNAREARKLFEIALEEHSIRLSREDDFSAAALTLITTDDVKRVRNRLAIQKAPTVWAHRVELASDERRDD